MTAIAIFFGVWHGDGLPRLSSTSRVNGSGLPETRGWSNMSLKSAAIW